MILTGRQRRKVVCSFCYLDTVKYILKYFRTVVVVKAEHGAQQLLSARMVLQWPDRVFVLRKDVQRGIGKSCLAQEMESHTSGSPGCDM